MKSPILGSSYVARSVNAADNRMVNLFPEIVPEGGKEPAFLQRVPGLALYVTNAGGGTTRGMRVVDGSLYWVTGDTLYSCDSTLSPINSLGTVVNFDSSPVSMSDNGTQLFIASRSSSTTYKGYIYNTSTLAFAEITDGDFTGAVTVAYLDGFFVYNQPFTQKIWVTALLDGTAIDPLHFASAETSPDDVVGLTVNGDELWVFGTNTTEVWYNAGTPNFPFAPIQGAYMEVGCAAPYSIAKLDNTIYWLGQDARGVGTIYKTNGYRAERVSTHAVEWQLRQYISAYEADYSVLIKATSYSYQQDGHLFYVISFPSVYNGVTTVHQGMTWVYDVSTQAWHERASWEAESAPGADDGYFKRENANCQALFNGCNIVGVFNNDGNLYKLDPDVYTDAGGGAQRWLRSWRALPTGGNNLKRTAHHSLQIDCDTGHGLNDVVDPTAEAFVSMRFSDDGGHTWSTARTCGMGITGAYGTRVIFRRLGMTMKLRDRVYEISGDDDVKIIIMGAELLLSPTDA